MRRKAFTLVELMVAMGVLAIVMAMAGVIFKAALKSHRMAVANADVLSKFRLISQQLDHDFQGLRKDGEIFVAWVEDPTHQGFRLDRIGFYSIGDFQNYGDDEVEKGRLARVTYMLGRRDGRPAQNQKPEERVLARSQHIYCYGSTQWLEEVAETNIIEANVTDWVDWHNAPDGQHDPNTLQDWLEIEREVKLRALWAIFDMNIVADAKEDLLTGEYGTQADPNHPDHLHTVLCEGVGQFRIESWYDDPNDANDSRWIPAELHVFEESELSSNEKIWSEPVRWLWYPSRKFEVDGDVQVQGEYHLDRNDPGDRDYEPILYDDPNLTPEHFDRIPGLGRALRFTVTLYDSRGLLEQGRTFTHIVQLD